MFKDFKPDPAVLAIKYDLAIKMLDLDDFESDAEKLIIRQKFEGLERQVPRENVDLQAYKANVYKLLSATAQAEQDGPFTMFMGMIDQYIFDTANYQMAKKCYEEFLSDLDLDSSDEDNLSPR